MRPSAPRLLFVVLTASSVASADPCSAGTLQLADDAPIAQQKWACRKTCQPYGEASACAESEVCRRPRAQYARDWACFPRVPTQSCDGQRSWDSIAGTCAAGSSRLTRGVPIAGWSGHSAVRLRDGRVLVSGGTAYGGAYSPRAAVWNPADEQWREVPRMRSARGYHRSVVLPDGRVLIAGGSSYDWRDRSGGFMRCAPTDLWDPKTERWSPGGCLEGDVVSLDALPDGTVIAWLDVAKPGAPYGVRSWVSMRFDPRALKWQRVFAVGSERYRDGAAVVRYSGLKYVFIGGSVPLTGGSPTSAMTVVDLGKMTVLGMPEPKHPIRRGVAIMSNANQLVVAGEGWLQSFDASTQQWDDGMQGANMPLALASGEVLLHALVGFALWTPGERATIPAGSTRQAGCSSTLTLLSDGRVLAVGGACERPTGPDFSEVWAPSSARK